MSRKIGVLTSGGDAPGMNAILYGLAQAAECHQFSLIGIREGLKGLCAPNGPECIELTTDRLAPWVSCGGTYIGTSRFPDFLKNATQVLAIDRLKMLAVDRLFLIGGEGSYHAALALSQKGQAVTAVPASIDNDVPGTDLAVGFATAVERVDKSFRSLETTAYSHQRIEILEVMGRKCPDLALLAGQSSGCLCTITQHDPLKKEQVLALARAKFEAGARYLFLCIAENSIDSFGLAQYLENETGHETRVTVLGQLQRAGDPSFYDKVFGKALGRFALNYQDWNQAACVVGLNRGKLSRGCLETVIQTPTTKSPPFFSEASTDEG